MADPTPLQVLQQAREALQRMERARDILTDGKPTPTCNWGLLDTGDLIARIDACLSASLPAAAVPTQQPSALQGNGRSG